jgi:aerobic carbon-monoxide dehydrogenase medium subunit
MKPVNFEFMRAHTVEEAASALLAADGGAKLVAGAQSLGPMLNLRLVQPQLLIDITGIPELTEVSEAGDRISIGACVTAANIEDGKVPVAAAPMLPRIAGGIAYRAVRNRGTIGGSLCHADPAADWVSTLIALGATCELAGAHGARREIPVRDFVAAAFENVLAEGELLRAVVVPKSSKRSRFGYSKISRKAGKFAMASGVVYFDPGRGVFQAVIGATDSKPILINDPLVVFGVRPDEGPLRFDPSAAATVLVQHGIADDARCQLHLAALRRAAVEAFSRD